MAISAVKEIEFINFNKLKKPISDFLSKESDFDKTNKEYAETDIVILSSMASWISFFALKSPSLYDNNTDESITTLSISLTQMPHVLFF